MSDQETGAGDSRATAAERDCVATVEAVLNTVADGVITIDESGVVLSFNRAGERLFGWRAAEIVGKNVSELMSSPDRERHDGYLGRYLQTGEAHVIGVGRRVLGRRKDGSVFPLHLAVSEVNAPGRRLFAGVVRDLSERERMEADLRREISERETATRKALGLSSAVDASVAAVVITDLAGTVSYVNAAALALWGFDDEAQVIGQHASTLLESPGKYQPVADAVIESGVWRGELRVRRRDESVRDVELTAVVLLDGFGKPAELLGTILDVTERKQMEEALRRSEGRHRMLFEHASDAIVGLDTGGRIIEANARAAEMTGLSREELLSTPLANFLLWEDLEQRPLRWPLLLAGTTVNFERRFRRADGALRLIEGTACLLPDGTIQAIVRDVTEKRRAERALTRTETLLGEVIATAPLILWAVDREGVFTLSRGRGLEVLGLLPDEVVGRSIYELYADVPGAVRNIERALAGEELTAVVEGRGLLFENHYFPERDPAGNVTGARGVSLDITERAQGERELRRTQARLADAHRIAGLGSWEWEVASGSLWWSDEVYATFGVLRGAFAPSYAGFLERVHPDDREAVRLAIAASLEDRTPYSVEHRIVRPGGEVRVVHERAEVVFDALGVPLRMTGTVQDVTEIRTASETLAMLSSAIQHTADHVFVTDSEGRIEYVNPAFERHTGFQREEVIGKTPRILKSDVHPPEFFTRLWARLAAGEVYRGIFVNRRKDGTTYHEEKSIAPIRDERGRISHFVSVGRDVTERQRAEEVQKRMQELVSRSAAEWRATFDAVASPVLLVDGEGRVSRVNRAARDLLGKSYGLIMSAAVPTERGEPWRAIDLAIKAATSSGKAVSMQARGEDGRTWDVGANPLTEPGLKAGGTIVLARDVSNFVELQDSLRRNETMSAMGRLVAGVAHEVRNPLFAISATLDAFDADFVDRPDYAQYAGVLRTEVERLTALMQELLDYGRPAPPEFSITPFRHVVERALRACAPQTRAAGANIEIALPEDDPLEVELDVPRLAQVLQNLIENALQHSPPGSTTSVVARRDVEAGVPVLICSVEDSGAGIRKEDLSRVFEPFFTRRRGGTGLGLSIVQRIVDQHGGRITATNRAAGGTAMTLVLPLRRPTSSAPGDV